MSALTTDAISYLLSDQSEVVIGSSDVAAYLPAHHRCSTCLCRGGHAGTFDIDNTICTDVAAVKIWRSFETWLSFDMTMIFVITCGCCIFDSEVV